MTDNINIDELLQLLQQQQNQQTDQQTLEQALISMILDPVRLQRQRIRIDSNLGDGVVFELREGTIINEHGIQEDIQELLINPETFTDGNPMNIYGVVRCPNCRLLVMQDSIRVCQFCGRICCLSRGCGRYSKFMDKWYCNRKHRAIGLLGINIR